MIALAIVIGVLLGGFGARARSRRLERVLDAKYPRDETGVIVGAAEIRRDGSNGAAVLLVHGAGDTPQTMHHLVDELQRRGYAVLAPLLPGHGRDLRDFAAHGADAWYAAVRDSYRQLRSAHDWVGVIGLSMGGALSARLAAETTDLPALVLASPYLGMPVIGRMAARTAWLWGSVIPVVSTSSDLSVLDPRARAVSLGYGAFTGRSLRALESTAMSGYNALAEVRAPTLVMQSTSDNRVSTATTTRAFERLGSTEKRIEWIEGAGHVITVDFGWPRVVALAADWMDSHR
jgi:carboxylesterase